MRGFDPVQGRRVTRYRRAFCRRSIGSLSLYASSIASSCVEQARKKLHETFARSSSGLAFHSYQKKRRSLARHALQTRALHQSGTEAVFPLAIALAGYLSSNTFQRLIVAHEEGPLLYGNATFNLGLRLYRFVCSSCLLVSEEASRHVRCHPVAHW